MQAKSPYLRVHLPNGQKQQVPLPTQNGEKFSIGRAPDVNHQLPDHLIYISGYHSRIMLQEGRYYVADGPSDDRPSRNGTYVNNEKIERPQLLHNGDVIRLGDTVTANSVGITFFDPREGEEGSVLNHITFDGKRIIIGRDPEAATLVLDHPSVSRVHAEIREVNGQPTLFDLNSRNGVFVNGVPVKEQVIQPGDKISIGSAAIIYRDNMVQALDSGGMRLDAVNLNKIVTSGDRKRAILNGINMTVMPREFVALVGGSGAGKSTLMGALNGSRRADGQVLLNGFDFYKYYDNYRNILGYVPQYEILHKTLPVDAALRYIAKIRLPEDTSEEEINERIERVLRDVDMAEPPDLRKRKVQDLSGGQQKRVSIAAELLAEPQLFFLDEPTSGLDPGLEKKMMFSMRRMADAGRTVILITHATANIVQCDYVGFLSEGNLVYFGPPGEAEEFFGVDDFADIYQTIQYRGEEWRQKFEQSNQFKFYEELVQERQKTIPQTTGQTEPQAQPASRSALIHQFRVLSQRMFDVLSRDRIGLAILMLMMPLIAAFLIFLTTPTDLVGLPSGDIFEDGEPIMAYSGWTRAQTNMFIMALAAVLLGLFGASNELIRERPIFLRETMVNLKLPPYLASKLAVFGGFALIQSLLLLLVMMIDIKLPGDGIILPGIGGFLEFLITLFLATMASISFGLLISSVSNSLNVSAYLVMLVLFIQIIFSGAIFKLEGAAGNLSYLTITRWTISGLGSTLDMDDLAARTTACIPTRGVEVCSQIPITDADMGILYSHTFGHIIFTWLMLIGHTALYSAGTYAMLQRTERKRE